MILMFIIDFQKCKIMDGIKIHNVVGLNFFFGTLVEASSSSMFIKSKGSIARAMQDNPASLEATI
jgi:hypothetical protein